MLRLASSTVNHFLARTSECRESAGQGCEEGEDQEVESGGRRRGMDVG